MMLPPRAQKIKNKNTRLKRKNIFFLNPKLFIKKKKKSSEVNFKEKLL